MMLRALPSACLVAGFVMLSACVQALPEQAEAVQDAMQKSSFREETAVSQTRTLQSALKWKGFYKGRIDGVIGKSTYDALTNYVVASSGGKVSSPTAENIDTLVSEYRASLDPSVQGSDGADNSDSSASYTNSGASETTSQSRTISHASYSNGTFSGGTVYSSDGTATEYSDEADFESAKESASADF